MAYTYTGGSGTLGNIVISNGGSGYTYATTSASPIWNNTGVFTVAGSNGSTGSGGSLSVSGDADFKGKVMINGQDLVETLETIQRRLAILVPDPKLLEKYEALKQAYEHYKTLEALCVETETPAK